MKRKDFISLLGFGLLGCKCELEDMNIAKKNWWSSQQSVEPPDYDDLTNVVFYGDYSGLVNGATNDYGTVSAGSVTLLKDPLYGTGVEFGSQGTAPTLSADGIVFGGSGNLRHTGLSSVFNDFHYKASIGDLKWTIWAIVKFGTDINPNAVYSFVGNNGGASTNNGIFVVYEDRLSLVENDALSLQITRGSSQSFISASSNGNIIPANEFCLIWLEVDKSQTQDNAVKLFINGTQIVISNRVDSSTASTTPTYAMEIGAAGNAVARAVMTIKEICFMNGVLNSTVRNTFMNAICNRESLSISSSIDSVTTVSTFSALDTVNDGLYRLSVSLCQSPIDANTIVSIYTNTTTHTHAAGAKGVMRKSTDKGLTWSAESTIVDPSGDAAFADSGAGYGSDGRLHLIYPTYTSITPPSTELLWYMYSDDDGATWSTPLDITSILAADSLNAMRVNCQIIENDGRLMTTIYKATDEGNTTNSAIYLIYSDDNGANWSYKTIKASSTTYINESSIVAISSTQLIVVSRNESTFEWTQYYSSNNGDTWASQGNLTFGESLPRACPARLRKFQISSTDIIACYYSDRNRDIFKVAYAKASDLSSGVSAWSTKSVLYQGKDGEQLQYGDVCHYDNNMNAIGMWPQDPFPGSGTGTTNKLVTFHVPTVQYRLLKRHLGL